MYLKENRFLQSLQAGVRKRSFYKLDPFFFFFALCHAVTQWISADYPSSTSPRFVRSSHLAGLFPLCTLLQQLPRARIVITVARQATASPLVADQPETKTLEHAVAPQSVDVGGWGGEMHGAENSAS